ncbi:MAG: hypothetical protein WAN03_11295 [Candidatus Sulfotelmatobacter sp.]
MCLLPALAWARDKPQEWTEVRSPHFVVATNGSEKQGRHIADQFERMRSVFHTAFPKLQIDVGAPIIVLAIKDEKDFRALEPEAYLAKGQLKLAGLFLRAPDKNYVLLRLDAEGDHPYSVVYHEYTHLLLSKAAEWIPLWMNEGLAEFYQNTDIREKEVLLGQPSVENLALLRQNRLLPLTTLLAVDEKSLYYHEENKGSIFYAESWALMHYIQALGHKENSSDELKHYGELLVKGIDPVSAATAAFGNLQQLQLALQSYVHQERFSYYRLNTTTEIDDSTFKVRALTAPQANALRADFLAYNQRFADAKSLLDQTLKDDPNNVSAHETMGFLEFRQGHLQEAQDWYSRAVKLDSQNYLAHYYNAAIAMMEGRSSANDPQVETSLRTSIRLNPAFAPSYDRLAMLLGMNHRDLDEARMMSLNAIGLDPSNIPYRLNMANIWVEMHNLHNAVQVLQTAAKVAKTSQDSAAVEDMLRRVQLYSDEQEQARQDAADDDNSTPQVSTRQTVDEVEDRTPPHEFVPFGPHHFLSGSLTKVQCKYQQMDLIVESSGKKLALHSDNYYKIQFTSLGFTPSGELNPCKDLEGRPGKVEYVESADKTVSAQVLSVELHK